MSINETGYDDSNGVAYYAGLPKVLRLNMSRTFQAGISLVRDNAKNAFNEVANFLQRLTLAMPDMSKYYCHTAETMDGQFYNSLLETTGHGFNVGGYDADYHYLLKKAHDN